MIYECTDCKHCASFVSGWRALCCNPELPATSMNDYHPVGEGDAIRCAGFDDSEEAVDFPQQSWSDAYDAQEAKGEDGTYEDMRQWAFKSQTWKFWRGRA